MGIAGKWEFVSSDKYSDYLKEIGVGMLNRTLANAARPTMEYIDNGDGKWTQKIHASRNFTLDFVSGVEFEETTPDDRKSKSTITVTDNTLVHKQHIDGKYDAVTTRVFTDKDMTTTFASGKITATRVFKKV